MARERAEKYKGQLQVIPGEDKIYRELEKEATAMITRIGATYSHKTIIAFAYVLKQAFQRIYEKIIVNEYALAQLRTMIEQRKGPVVFCPTHRSYIDFLILSFTLLFYKIETPHICAGEDFLNIIIVNNLLRSAGAFFMRRTFKGDDLYKAVFKEYVALLLKDKMVMEFFIEGTRSRTNKVRYF